MDSVCRQTHSCEHIVVDGGSADGTVDLIRKFPNPRLRFFSEPGVGISRGFNIGFEQATGDIIGVLNADDWYEPDAVERTVQCFIEQPEIEYTYGTVVVHWPTFKVLAHPVNAGSSLKEQIIQMPFWHVSAFIKRSLYQRFGPFDESFRYAMDHDFFVKCFVAGAKGAEISGILAHATGGGLTGNVWNTSREFYRVSAKHIGRMPALYHQCRLASRSLLFRFLAGMPGLRHHLEKRPGSRFSLLPE